MKKSVVKGMGKENGGTYSDHTGGKAGVLFNRFAVKRSSLSVHRQGPPCYYISHDKVARRPVSHPTKVLGAETSQSEPRTRCQDPKSVWMNIALSLDKICAEKLWRRNEIVRSEIRNVVRLCLARLLLERAKGQFAA
jgi:hypothetical protein